MSKVRLIAVLFATLLVAGCGYGHATLRFGGCPAHIDPAIVVQFEDRISGRPLAVDASGVLIHGGQSKLLSVYEPARPDPYVYSLFADVSHGGFYRLELFVARTVDSPVVEIVYEDIDIYFDSCGPITRYIDVRVD